MSSRICQHIYGIVLERFIFAVVTGAEKTSILTRGAAPPGTRKWIRWHKPEELPGDRHRV
ncbi:hypothetical protein [Cryobacterium arcticum]|uniref:hypothetical protein n=1 Tax=Cryobacterium arcticum TaxID=670052 RepID=UPI001AD8207A|nr:hypothetical protein [Cryobacterium arcticum]